MTVVFNTKRRQYDAHRDTLSCTSECPSCDTEIHFWLHDMVAHARKDGSGDPSIYMMPYASADSVDFNQFAEKVPESILSYCISAQDVYRLGNLTAANVMIQTALESIFAEFLPDGKSSQTLADVIRDSLENVKQHEPISNLSDDIISGDLDVLFQHHQDTSQETADAMMALLETLINYLFIMPDKFRNLQEQFSQINSVSKLSRRGDEDRDSVLQQAG